MHLQLWSIFLLERRDAFGRDAQPARLGRVGETADDLADRP
jgi:hypothetical protein